MNLQDYVLTAEVNKKTFVLGDEAKHLMEEVQQALIRKMKSRWQTN